MRYLFHLTVLLLVAFCLGACKQEGCINEHALNYDPDANEDDCSCTSYADEMEGTFKVTVTSYPRQPAQEGDEFEALVFRGHGGCSSSSLADLNTVKFNNLFSNHKCEILSLNEHAFMISVEDHVEWLGAPLEGEGSIEDGALHFEGTVYTSAGTFPLVLDGIKTSEDRRTDAC